MEEYPAEWARYGRAAGPDRGMAFHPDLARSRGTADMVRQLRKAGVPGEVFAA